MWRTRTRTREPENERPREQEKNKYCTRHCFSSVFLVSSASFLLPLFFSSASILYHSTLLNKLAVGYAETHEIHVAVAKGRLREIIMQSMIREQGRQIVEQMWGCSQSSFRIQLPLGEKKINE
jgi:hypothetical protein